MDILRENLASIQHEIWAHWMRYLFSVSQRNEDGSYTIPSDKASRWLKQIEMHYNELMDSEQESDREQADKVIAALK